CGQHGRQGAVHAAGHPIGPYPAYTALAEGIHCIHHVFRGGATGAHDEAGQFIADLLRAQPGVFNCLRHGQIAPAGGTGHKAAELAVNHTRRINPDMAAHVGAQSHFFKFLVLANAALALTQGLFYLRLVFSQAGDHTNSCHDRTPHDTALTPCTGLRPARRFPAEWAWRPSTRTWPSAMPTTTSRERTRLIWPRSS